MSVETTPMGPGFFIFFRTAVKLFGVGKKRGEAGYSRSNLAAHNRLNVASHDRKNTETNDRNNTESHGRQNTPSFKRSK